MKKRTLLSLPIITIMLLSVGLNFSATTVKAENKNSDDTYEIYPVPHSVDYDEGVLSLDDDMQVIYDDTIDDVTKDKVTNIFEDNDLPIPEPAESPSDDKVQVLVGTKGSDGPVDQYAEDNLENSSMNFDETDAYQLNIDNNTITVLGKDTDAAFYGLASLEKILDQSSDNGNIQNLDIQDYSNTKVRGFIEGFYGIPWSNEDRKSLMEFGGQFKTTSYIFAPKDDPYHREKWEKLYPQEELDEISEMAEVGRENKTNFVWSISPLGEAAAVAQKEGDEAAMELLDENTEKLLAKFDQLYDAGVRQFGVLGDDVGALPLDYVVQQMDAISEWADEKGDVKDTIYTPAAYNSAWAWDGGKELNKLEKHFADNIHILWTGSTTVAPVTQSTIDDFKNLDNNGVERRDPLFWLNWPVNDVDMTRVFLGKGDMLNPGVEDLAGVVTNPMQEAEASKVSIFAIADYAWNTETFDAEQSWQDSMKYVEPDATEAFHTLAKHMAHAEPQDGLTADESENIKELLNETISRLEKGEALGDNASELITELQTIAEAGDTFLSETKNENLKEELEPFVNALRDMALADIDYLKAQQAIEDNNKEKAWNLARTASSLREQSLNHERPMLEGKNNINAKPAAKRLQPFSDKLEEKVTQNAEALMDVSPTDSNADVFTNVDDYKDLSITEKLAVTEMADSTKVELEKNEYIGLKLNRIKDLSKIKVDKPEGLTLQTSLNGIEWDTVKDVDHPDDARYVRLINKTKDPVKFSLNTFKVKSDEIYPISMVDKNIQLRDSDPLNLLDGDLSSFTWFAEAQKEGQLIEYDLGQQIDLNRLKVYVQENEGDFPRHAVIESSLNGDDWNTAMSIGNQDGPNEGETSDNDSVEDIFQEQEGNYRTKEVTDLDQEARYLRLRVTRTKQGTGNWLRMQEIEINGGELTSSVDRPQSTVDKNVKLRDSEALNLLDGDLTNFTWFAKAQKKGQFIEYDLGKQTDLNRLKVYVQENEEDFPRHAVIESSLDGDDWNTVMSIGNQEGPNEGEASDEDSVEDIFQKHEGRYRSKEVTDIDQEARYLRFRVTRTKQGTGNWLRMQEIEINGAEHYKQINDPTVTTTSDVSMNNIVQNIIDGKLSTKFRPVNDQSGEAVHHVGEAEKNITGITLLEDSTNPSNSKVSIRTLNGWKELGTTETGYSFFDVADEHSILDIKIEWEKGNAPSLYEVKINKEKDSGNVESTIKSMQTVIEQYADEGKIEGPKAERLLHTHLTSIDHFVKRSKDDKAVKHMNGFKKLVERYQEQDQMDENAAETLTRHADILIERWQ